MIITAPTRRELLMGAASVLSLSAGGALAADSGAGRGAPTRRFGVQTHYGQQAWKGRETQTHLAGAGIKTNRVRDELYWASLEKSPGVYDWDYGDRVLGQIMSGVDEAIISFDFGNPLYNSSDKTFPDTDKARAAFAAYVLAVLDRYGRKGKGLYAGRIAAAEIWNEVNGAFSGGYPPRQAALLLAKLTLAVSQAVRADRDFDAIPILGCAAVNVPLNFIKWTFDEGIGKAIDGVVIHPYGPPEDIYARSRELRALLDTLGFKGPIWATEFGNLRAGDVMLKSLACVAASPIVRGNYYLSQSDGAFSTGLLDASGALTEVGRVWKAWAPWLDSARFVGRAAPLQAKTWGLQFASDKGQTFTVLWSQWGMTTLKLSGDHQAYDAEGALIAAGGTYALTTAPIVIVGKPRVSEDLGSDRLLADAYGDFALTQNEAGWNYRYRTSRGEGELQRLTEDQQGDGWGFSGMKFATLSAKGAHPGVGLEVVRRWTVPAEVRRVRILGEIGRGPKGDGVNVQVMHNQTPLVSRRALLAQALSFDQVIDVAAGDQLDFLTGAGPGSDIEFDTTNWSIALYETQAALTQADLAGS